jgi:hypothetical protein
MTSVRAYLRQHHVGLIAIALIISGGTAYAVTAPKNSVTSQSIKNGQVKSSDLRNNSAKGKDVKDGSLTGTDVQDGSLQGADIGSQTITDLNLDPDAVDEVHSYYYASGVSDNVVWSDPAVGTITFSVSCNPDYTVNSFVSAVQSPARAGVYGLELHTAPGEAAGAAPLIGAATVSRLNDVGQPVGGAGFGGGPFGFGDLVLFVQSARVDVYVDLKISYCGARGTILVDHKPAGSVIEARPGTRSKKPVCVTSGAAASCTKPDAT